ncbi:universal stress family protein, partial [Bordetella hinzii L60]
MAASTGQGRNLCQAGRLARHAGSRDSKHSGPGRFSAPLALAASGEARAS